MLHIKSFTQVPSSIPRIPNQVRSSILDNIITFKEYAKNTNYNKDIYREEDEVLRWNNKCQHTGILGMGSAFLSSSKNNPGKFKNFKKFPGKVSGVEMANPVEEQRSSWRQQTKEKIVNPRQDEGDPKNTEHPGNKPKGASEVALHKVATFTMDKVFPVLFLRALRINIRSISHNDKGVHLRSSTYKDERIDKDKLGDVLGRHLSMLNEKYREIVNRVYVKSKEIYQQNLKFVTDRSSEAHLTMASFVLGAYRELTETFGMSHNDVIIVLQNCICGNLHAFMSYMIKMPINLSDNPIPSLASKFSTISRLKGEGFQVELERDPTYNAYLFVKVKRCFFNDFFNENKASYLTSLFCTAELKMFEDINPMKKFVRFDLPSKLSTGGKVCNFQFRKMQEVKDMEFCASS